MVKLVANYAKLVIPFVYNSDTSIDNTIWDTVEIKTQHLNREVISKINGDNQSRIGRSYLLTQQARHRYMLPRDNRVKMTLKARQVNSVLVLNSVGLHLFENDIGFIEFDVSYDCHSCNEFLQANYFLAELEEAKNVLVYMQKTGKDQSKEISFSLANKAMELLEGILVHSFDAHFSPQLRYLKPHCFSYLLLEKDDGLLYETLFRAKNVYKDSYQVYEGEANKHYYQPFANSCWGFSTQGVATISFLTDNEATNEFFKVGFLSATKMQYFYLYLLALNQKYSMLRQNDTINSLSGQLDELNYEELLHTKATLDDITAKTISYILRNSIETPSEISHINNYYDCLEERLELVRIEKRLSRRLQDVALLSETYYARIVAADGKKQQFKAMLESIKRIKIEILIFVITQIIGSVSLFKLVWDVIEKMMGEAVTTDSWLFSIPIIAVGVFILILCLQIYLRVVELKKLYQIKRTEEKDLIQNN